MKKIMTFGTMKVAAFLLVAVMAVSLAACGAGGSAKDSAVNSSGAAGAAQASPPAYPNAMYPSGDEVYADASESPMAADSANGADYDYGSAKGAVGEAASTAPNASQSGRKITFSADYTIETKRFDEDYGRIDALVKKANGYIANENTDAHSYYSGSPGRSSWLSLRIPIGDYDDFLADIEGVGDVVNKSKSSQDLTSQYFDTEARIELLEMRKARLIAYIETAEDPEVIIEFERELSNVLYDLDNYQGTKRGLDQLVDFATIDVNLYEVITAETIGKDGQPLGERAQNAFSLSLIGVGDFLKGAAVFFAGAAPVIALIAIVLIVIWLIVKLIRRIRRKYDETHAERLQAKQRKKQEEVARKWQRKHPAPYYGRGYGQAGTGQTPQTQQTPPPSAYQPVSPPTTPPPAPEAVPEQSKPKTSGPKK